MDEQLPEPNTLESAKSYYKRIKPKLNAFANSFMKLRGAYLSLQEKYHRVKERNYDLEGRIERVSDQRKYYEDENVRLREVEKDLQRVKNVYGKDSIEEAIIREKNLEKQQQNTKKTKQKKIYEI